MEEIREKIGKEKDTSDLKKKTGVQGTEIREGITQPKAADISRISGVQGTEVREVIT